MLLAITALGYASVWLDGVLRLEEKAKKLERLFNLPEEVHASVLLPVGIPAEAGQPSQKKPFEERAGFNRYMADN
jgi:nitroreductase